MIDLAACKQYGVTVSNVPAASNESVAEHAISLFFALRRKVVRMHGLTVEGSLWGKTGSLKDEFGECPGTCREEVVGVIGGGELGGFLLSSNLSLIFVLSCHLDWTEE